ncbi:Fanconi anemia group I protein-like [Homarus americanus]|uniref:Fanconi anemia group I protein-like n=1 Tax=Homarus americanus TaxID=6706 RepID=A0A8J5TBX8_HOMAM|nr:Fanconi anemia group I protein-like [Homarus americanus]
MTGDDYRYQVLKSFCDLSWCAETTTSLLPVFKDMNLPKEELHDVIFKVERVLKEVDYQSVPPIIYHLILLMRRDLPGRILQVVIDYFNSQENKLKQDRNNVGDEINSLEFDSEVIENSKYSDLTEAKGTVILHVTHHAQYNAALVRDYLKFIRSSTWLAEKLITPFNLALSLSLASIEKYKDQILEALKSCLLKLSSGKRKPTVSVSQGLVHLSFNLLESGSGPKGETYVSQRAIELASTVLPLIVKKQQHLGRSVISQLSNLILTASSPVQYIEILGKLAKMLPLVLLDHLNVIREPLEFSESLSLRAATHFLSAILPLLKMSMSLKDALMITLRKMLFSKKVESRQIAVRGFLQFLRHFRVMGALPSSQASMSFSSSMSTVSVKSIFYLGLYDVSQNNPNLVVNIMELLLQHSKCFLDLRPDIFNPVILKKVIVILGETTILTEPMGDLLSSLGACKTYYEEHHASEANEEDDENAITVLNEICAVFDVLTEKLSGCGLEDLGFDTNGDFSTTSPSGHKNIFSAKVMIGVFDSLLEYTFTSKAQTPEERMQVIVSLFKSQRKIVELLKEKSKKPKKKGGRVSRQTIALKSHLSLRVTADMLAVSLSDSDTDASDSGFILKGNHELQLYLLSIVEDVLSSVKGMTRSEKEKILPHLRTIAKVLLRECTDNLGSADSSDEREVTRLRQSLHIIANVLTIFNKFYKHKVETILKDLMNKNDNKSLNALLFQITKRFQKMLLKILHHKERTPLLKDAITIVHIVTAVTQAMEPQCSEVKDVQDWVHQLCKDQDFGHCGLTEAMMNLLMKLSNQIKGNHNLTRGIAKELYHRLGKLGVNVSIDEPVKYMMVTGDTSSVILSCLLVHLDDTLGLIELALNKMKACVVSGTQYNAEKVENCISLKCNILIQALHEVVQSAIPLGVSTDHTLKVVTKMYNVLALYAKFYIDLYRIKNYAQISDKFETIVHKSGELITKPIYPLITYIEGTHREAGSKIQRSITARAMKETKLIPSLIFAIEQYEKHLITLTHKSKVNLMQKMGVSTCRDFKIMPATLKEVLQKENEEEQENVLNSTDEEAGSDDQEEEEATHRKVESSLFNRNKREIKRKSCTEMNEDDENDPNSQNRTSGPPSKHRKISLGKKGKKYK